MRAGAGFNATAVTEVVSPSVARGAAGHSAWHSPVPYLFGGLAAMLGLIAFALLILACSYWKLSGYFEGARDGGSADSDGGREPDEKPKAIAVIPTACYEEKVVAIMVGDEKPTYIATPVSSRASSFGDHSSKGDVQDKKSQKGEDCKGAGNETRDKEQNHESRSESQSQDV